MDTLPEELVSYIISYLDLRCQLRLSAVSVWWRAAVADCLRRRQRLSLKDLEHRFWTNDVLRMLLPRLPALRALSGQRSYDHGKLDVDIVSENCPLLEKLDLSLFRLDPDCLERLCQRCPRLWDVRLPYYCKSDLLELVLRRLPGLRSLKLAIMDISATDVELLPAGLERLELGSCRLLTGERQPADRWPRLTELDVVGSKGRLAELVAGCPRLQRLKAHKADADDHMLELLPAVPLQHLDISFCKNLTEDCLVKCLGRDISGVFNVTDRVLDSLAGVQSLIELTLSDGLTVRAQYTLKALERLSVASPSLRLWFTCIREGFLASFPKADGAIGPYW